MKRAYTFVCVALLLLLLAGTVSAQKGYQGLGMYSCMPIEGLSLERLALTGEQRTAVERIEKAYNDRMSVLKGKLMTRRLELQSAFRDSHADEEMIRAKAREVFETQNECQHVAVDFQIEIRRILTSEQLGNWRTPGDWCIQWKPR